jgi:hypothetical protein
MAGTTLMLFNRRLVDCTPITNGGTQDQIMTRYLDISPWREATLLLRVHSTNITTSGHVIQIILQFISLSPDDPSLDFVIPLPAAPATTDVAAVAEVQQGMVTPRLIRAPVAANAGTGLRLLARGYKTGSGGANLSAVLSADLSLKD